jgi:hypothetical protein
MFVLKQLKAFQLYKYVFSQQFELLNVNNYFKNKK